MSIYLPIAEIPIDVFLLLIVGTAGGLLAGLFGIGGGFLVTPILIFIGVPPSVAVATSANQIIASSLTGFLAQLRRNNVDIKMGMFLLIGGLIGSYIGIIIFAWLKSIGQIDVAISLIYVLFLGSIGALMFLESGKNLLHLDNHVMRDKKHKFHLIDLFGFRVFVKKLKKIELPYVIEFPSSGLKVSCLSPVFIGTIAGVMVSIMGIGGGFLMIPAMIYILKMPANMVVGTSLFQIIFISSVVTVMHSVSTQSVDMLLASILIIGGVVGAQFGSRISLKIPAIKLRFALSILILLVCLRLAGGLFIEPNNIYSLTPVEEGE